MRRRDFFRVFVGSAAAFACAARAQQPDHMRRIGVLSSVAADDPDNKIRITGFRQRLEQLGWTDGTQCAD
jgi:putative ABC transport system substrate-binding protein